MFTAQDVMKLREKTGVGMMDCKKALVEADGDMDKAMDILREKGMATSSKRANKIASQGITHAYIANGVGVLVEINCESDFVARGDAFKALAEGIAQYIAEANPVDVAAVTAAKADLINENVAKIGEKIVVRRFERYEQGSDTKLESYIHMGGKIGVLVQATANISDELLHDVALQIAASAPVYISTEDVPQEAVAKEKEIAYAQAVNEGKPAAIVEKMIPGRIQKFYKEVCLLEQIFVKDLAGKSSVKQVLKDAQILKFTRFAMGEGLEKKEENLADEVNEQIEKMKAGH